MTPAIFKNRHMTRVKFFAKYKKEPFESFETLEETYEMPEVSDFEIKNAITQVLSTLTPREERVIRERFFNNKTLEEVGQIFEKGYGQPIDSNLNAYTDSLASLNNESTFWPNYSSVEQTWRFGHNSSFGARA